MTADRTTEGIVTGRYPVPAEDGQRVTFSRKTTNGREEGYGTFLFAWLGIEEAWKVRTDEGRVVNLFPCFGDTMAPA